MTNIFGYDRKPPKEVFDPSFSVMAGRDPDAHRLDTVQYRRAIEGMENVRTWRTGPYNVWLAAKDGATVTLPPDSTMAVEDGQLVLRIPFPWGTPPEAPTP